MLPNHKLDYSPLTGMHGSARCGMLVSWVPISSTHIQLHRLQYIQNPQNIFHCHPKGILLQTHLLGVSNSMLTDKKKQVSERVRTTTLVIDQNSSGVKVRYMVSLYTNPETQTIPNKCTAMQCTMQCRRMMQRSHHLAQELLDP